MAVCFICLFRGLSDAVQILFGCVPGNKGGRQLHGIRPMVDDLMVDERDLFKRDGIVSMKAPVDSCLTFQLFACFQNKPLYETKPCFADICSI